MALIDLMMEAVQTSETSVNLHESTRRNNPENSHLHTHLRENLKSRGLQNILENSKAEAGEGESCT
jgi:hypothetical protein